MLWKLNWQQITPSRQRGARYWKFMSQIHRISNEEDKMTIQVDMRVGAAMELVVALTGLKYQGCFYDGNSSMLSSETQHHQTVPSTYHFPSQAMVYAAWFM